MLSCTTSVTLHPFDIRCEALVDSGSSTSFLSTSVFQNLNVPMCIDNKQFSAVNDSILKCHGTVRINLDIAGVRVDQTFCVIDSSIPIILGLDALQNFKIQIDFGKQTVTIHDIEVESKFVGAFMTITNPYDLDISIDINRELNVELRRKTTDIIKKYAHCFCTGSDDIGRVRGFEVSLDTGNYSPCKRLPYRIPIHRKQVISKEVKRMYKMDVIQPSTSPWCSPPHVVSKSDGSNRLVIDFREVNKRWTDDCFPLPHAQDLFDALGGAKCFSSLDAQNGFWQIPLDKEARPVTAFIADGKLWEFKVLPFGLKTASSIFQRVMSNILADLPFCIVDIDDILIFSNSEFQHLGHIEQVLQRIEQSGLKLKPSKCHFFRKEIKFLGRIISERGISTDPEKTVVIKYFPLPTTVKSVVALLECYNLPLDSSRIFRHWLLL